MSTPRYCWVCELIIVFVGLRSARPFAAGHAAATATGVGIVQCGGIIIPSAPRLRLSGRFAGRYRVIGITALNFNEGSRLYRIPRHRAQNRHLDVQVMINGIIDREVGYDLTYLAEEFAGTIAKNIEHTVFGKRRPQMKPDGSAYTARVA